MDSTTISWTNLAKSSYLISEEQFWNVVKLWKQNTHVVNRRVCSIAKLDDSTYCGNNNVKLIYVIDSMIESIKERTQINRGIWMEVVESLGINDYNEVKLELSLRKVLSRNSDHFHECIELVILDEFHKTAIFINISEYPKLSVLPITPYCIAYRSGVLILEIFSKERNSDTSHVWLCSQLLPRLEKWSVNTDLARNKTEGVLTVKTLSLVNAEKYNNLYQNLKKKYGREMVRIWPECTDPTKFVYEDVAIAAYLLLIWEEENLERCSFIDLGCGNGLLVHILNSEGHNGIGLDVRERKIWSVYPSTAKLKVETIIPSEQTTYPNADWLIGNHSDELTPWIPVMAARSSQKTRFFVLPCCSFEFDGRKFNRRSASHSQYHSYLQYIKTLSEECGFLTSVDRLRIPSTKRICFIGRQRNYQENQWPDVNDKIKLAIKQGCCDGDNDINGSQWIAVFKPREKEEKVRNCTKIDRSLQETIVTQVTSKLLTTENYLPSKRDQNTKWNAGGCLPMGEVVKLIAPEQLKRLKSECGGLQTLLRNHHQIFRVEGGQVRMRLPKSKSPFKSDTQKPRFCMRPCWFHLNHPDGCLLRAEDCSFTH